MQKVTLLIDAGRGVCPLSELTELTVHDHDLPHLEAWVGTRLARGHDTDHPTLEYTLQAEEVSTGTPRVLDEALMFLVGAVETKKHFLWYFLP